jgi:hypothetical protein
MLQLQRTIGNQSAQRLIQSKIGGFAAGSAKMKLTSSIQGASRRPVHGNIGNSIQLKREGSSQENQNGLATDAVSGEVMQRRPAGGAVEPEEEKKEFAQAKCAQEGEEVMQGKLASSESSVQLQAEGGKAENRTGMPSPLKSGLEQLSGMDLSSVRVHSNSPKPAQRGALAYTQGEDIHLGPGQERHLPHEGWHAVQQMQGRVSPTMHADDASINDDTELEQEADQMGVRANRLSAAYQSAAESSAQMEQYPDVAQMQTPVIQRVAPAFLGLSAAAWGVAANVAAVVGTASAVAGGTYIVAAPGENKFGSLVLPSNQMSDGDKGKLRQIARFRIINAYVERYLSVHSEVRDQLYPVYGPPLPPGFQEPAGGGGGSGGEGAGGGGESESAERPTGSPTESAIDEAVMVQVRDAIENELNIAMETATGVGNSTIEFRWGEDDTRGRGVGEGGSGSAESIGVTGFLRFRDLEGSVLTETLSLSSDASAAVGSVPNEGMEMLVHRFIGGSIGGVVEYSYLQNLTVNIEGGAVQVGVAANGSPKLIVRTHWHWDRWGANVDTHMRNEIHVTDSGTINITESRESSPNDEPFASEPEEGSFSVGTQIPKP